MLLNQAIIKLERGTLLIICQTEYDWLDFCGLITADSQGQETERGQKCNYNVVIEEDSQYTSEGLCGNRRDTQLYTSETNTIQVYINYLDLKDIPAFGIKYEGNKLFNNTAAPPVTWSQLANLAW